MLNQFPVQNENKACCFTLKLSLTTTLTIRISYGKIFREFSHYQFKKESTIIRQNYFVNSSFHLSDILVARGVRLPRHRGLVAELCALTAGDLMEVYSLVAGGRWLLAPSLELSLASEVPGSWALGTLLCKHRHSGPRVWRNLATFLPTPAEISLWQCSKSNMQTILLSCSSICRRGEKINIKQI